MSGCGAFRLADVLAPRESPGSRTVTDPTPSSWQLGTLASAAKASARLLRRLFHHGLGDEPVIEEARAGRPGYVPFVNRQLGELL
jgi:AraC-like DNA-binding protein